MTSQLNFMSVKICSSPVTNTQNNEINHTLTVKESIIFNLFQDIWSFAATQAALKASFISEMIHVLNAQNVSNHMVE